MTTADLASYVLSFSRLLECVSFRLYRHTRRSRARARDPAHLEDAVVKVARFPDGSPLTSARRTGTRERSRRQPDVHPRARGQLLLAAGPEGSYTIKLVDMGSSLFTSWWHPPIIGTMEYRAPETLLQVGSLLAHPGLPPLFCKFLAQQRWAISMICERRPHHACF